MRKYASYFFTILTIVSALVCFALFLCLMGDIWIKFKMELTTTGAQVEVESIPGKSAPCMTVCPFESFRTPGITYHYD